MIFPFQLCWEIKNHEREHDNTKTVMGYAVIALLGPTRGIYDVEFGFSGDYYGSQVFPKTLQT